MRQIRQSQKLQHVRYDVRGPILVEAQRLEAEGHRILKLNIGNPAPFGFEAPDAILRRHDPPPARGAGLQRLAQGIYPARTAVAQYYQERGLTRRPCGRRLHRQRRLRADLDGAPGVRRRRQRDPGAGSGLPALDRRRHARRAARRCTTAATRRNGWDPDLADIEAKITENTHALVIINPNNPTGAVYSEETVRGARRHRPAPRAGRHGRRDLREDPLRRRGPPPRGDVRRRRRALPDLQRAVQGLPGLRLPRRLGDDLGPQGAGRRTSSRA